MRGPQHRRNPIALRVQGGLPRPGGLLGVQRLPQAGGELLTRTGAPPGLTRVGEKHHRPHHTIRKRVRIPVGVVRLRH